MKVPLKIQENEIESGKIYISCLFDGIRDNLCHLDTGSTYTSIKWNEKFLNYPVSGSKVCRSASGISVEEEMITLESFRIGEFEKHDFEVVRYCEEKGQESRIGMSLMSNLFLNFNFLEESLLLKTSPNENLENILEIDKRGLFYVNSEIEGSIYKALWDTGAELTVVNPEVIESFSKNFEFVMDIPGGSDATGSNVFFKLYKGKGLKIQGHQLVGNVLSMNFEPLKKKLGVDVDIILGFNHIRQLNWSFDLHTKTWSMI